MYTLSSDKAREIKYEYYRNLEQICNSIVRYDSSEK